VKWLKFFYVTKKRCFHARIYIGEYVDKLIGRSKKTKTLTNESIQGISYFRGRFLKLG